MTKNLADKDIGRLFKDRQADQVKLIQESISDIQSMIKEREELNSKMISSMEKIDLSIDNKIPSMEALQGSNPAAAQLMNELMKKKIEIEEIKLQEMLNYWRDVALLKKELREHMKEYRELESKTSMVDSILDI